MNMDVIKAPDPDELSLKLAEIHRKGESPTGSSASRRHLRRHDAAYSRWQDSCAEFFARLLQSVCKLDTEANGRWPGMELALLQLVDTVIPRLMDSLTHKGQPVEPTIIHGDLWEPNLGTDHKTDRLLRYECKLVLRTK